MQKAGELADQGKFSAAVVLLRKAAEIDEASTEAHLALGKAFRDAGYYFLDNGLFDESLKAYDRNLERESRHIETLFAKAVLLYEGGKFAEALAILDSLPDGTEASAAWLIPTYRRVAKWHLEVFEKVGETVGKATEAHCALCWQALPESRWALGDGRVLCETCFSQAINDDRVLTEIYKMVVEHLATTLGMTLKRSAPAHLVNQEEIRRLAGQSTRTFDGIEVSNLSGLYSPLGNEPRLYVLNGLPRFAAVEVMAHEYAHAWSGENCPPDTPLGVSEGFSEWIAWETLKGLGYDREAARMFLERGPYGVHFKRFAVMARIRGPRGLIENMREGIR